MIFFAYNPYPKGLTEYFVLHLKSPTNLTKNNHRWWPEYQIEVKTYWYLQSNRVKNIRYIFHRLIHSLWMNLWKIYGIHILWIIGSFSQSIMTHGVKLKAHLLIVLIDWLISSLCNQFDCTIIASVHRSLPSIWSLGPHR